MRLLEDGGERGGTLISDLVVRETARDGWGHSESASVSRGTDTNANTSLAVAH